MPRSSKMPRRKKKTRSYNPDASPLASATDIVPLGDTNSRIIFTYEKVRIYFKSSPAYFISNSEDDEELMVVEYKDCEGQKSLEVGNFKTILEYGTVTYERSDLKTFIFQICFEDRDVKLIFPSEAAVATCDRFDNLLRNILDSGNNVGIHEQYSGAGSELVEYRSCPPDRGHRSTSVMYENAYVIEADAIKQGLEYGAERVSSAMDWIAPILINQIEPKSNKTEVDPTLQVGLKAARYAAEGAAVASEVLGKQVGALASYAAKSLAPHVERFGTEVLTENYNYTPEEASSVVKNALELTAEVAEGILTVFDGVVNAMKTIGNSFSENAVKVVKHAYGESAGEAVDDALSTFGNIGASRLNSRLRTTATVLQAARNMKPSPRGHF